MTHSGLLAMGAVLWTNGIATQATLDLPRMFLFQVVTIVSICFFDIVLLFLDLIKLVCITYRLFLFCFFYVSLLFREYFLEIFS